MTKRGFTFFLPLSVLVDMLKIFVSIVIVYFLYKVYIM